MSKKELGTEAYKGVRDFYPEDMAIQRYIFDVWGNTAESFGFERYDASILEPSELYKSKGAENEEMVNEQTYTFTDRGGREVTLRPEMTPTVARMVAGRRRELRYPVRWYSIPNLFRYERPQKGRLREHYQLNCDVFGADHFSIDAEIIALAHQMMLNFGATEKMFEIRINNRKEMSALYNTLGVTNPETQTKITRLNDRFRKIKKTEYLSLLTEIVKDHSVAEQIFDAISDTKDTTNEVVEGLRTLGIKNVVVDRTLARGFDYYTGTIFELFDVSGENNRSMLGGGRYDNLTGLFGGEPITGIGFGMGDVTMRDFLETHKLLKSIATAPTLMILPMKAEQNMPAQEIANAFRKQKISVAVDASSKKISKKISDASSKGAKYVLVLGENELTQKVYSVKNLASGKEASGTLVELIAKINS
jgi:histidyl-tRNA synthetase